MFNCSSCELIAIRFGDCKLNIKLRLNVEVVLLVEPVIPLILHILNLMMKKNQPS